MGDHRDLGNADTGQGLQHFLAWVSSWVCGLCVTLPLTCPLFDMCCCSQLCPEADRAKGRKGLFWHEALATFAPKKYCFFSFSPNSGLCLALIEATFGCSYCSKGKALGWRGDEFCRAVPRAEKGAGGMGAPQSFPSTGAVSGNLSSGTGSSKQTLHYPHVKYNPDIPVL